MNAMQNPWAIALLSRTPNGSRKWEQHVETDMFLGAGAKSPHPAAQEKFWMEANPPMTLSSPHTPRLGHQHKDHHSGLEARDVLLDDNCIPRISIKSSTPSKASSEGATKKEQKGQLLYIPKNPYNCGTYIYLHEWLIFIR